MDDEHESHGSNKRKNKESNKEKMVRNVDKMLVRKWKTDISDLCYNKLDSVVNESDPNFKKCLSKLGNLYQSFESNLIKSNSGKDKI